MTITGCRLRVLRISARSNGNEIRRVPSTTLRSLSEHIFLIFCNAKEYYVVHKLRMISRELKETSDAFKLANFLFLASSKEIVKKK